MEYRIPIIRVHQVLIVSIQTEVEDELVNVLKNDIAHEIRSQNAEALVVEVSGIDVFDSYIARSVRDLAQICALMGARTILVGLDPGMAITLTEMGMEMTGVETALDLDQALERFGLVSIVDKEALDPVAQEVAGDPIDWILGLAATAS